MTETEKKAVGRYLDWHTGILLETDGKMGIYRKESGKLIYKEKADSEDGYLGMYLFSYGKISAIYRRSRMDMHGM